MAKSRKLNTRSKRGDVITYHVPEPEVLEYVAEDIPLEIVYQDEDVAVVNKPQEWLCIRVLVILVEP